MSRVLATGPRSWRTLLQTLLPRARIRPRSIHDQWCNRHGRLRPIALQSEQADDSLMGMDRERKMASWASRRPQRSHLLRWRGRPSAGETVAGRRADRRARERLPSHGGSGLPVGGQAPRTAGPRPRRAGLRGRPGRAGPVAPNSAAPRLDTGGRSWAIARWRLLPGRFRSCRSAHTVCSAMWRSWASPHHRDDAPPPCRLYPR